MNKFIRITYNKIISSDIHTTILLGTEEKKFAIYASPSVGQNLEVRLSPKGEARPSTHTLMQEILDSFELKPLQVLIYDVQDKLYFAKLFLQKNAEDRKTIVEIDSRPSDSILLALMYNAPIYCNKETFDKTIPVQTST